MLFIHPLSLRVIWGKKYNTAGFFGPRASLSQSLFVMQIPKTKETWDWDIVYVIIKSSHYIYHSNLILLSSKNSKQKLFFSLKNPPNRLYALTSLLVLLLNWLHTTTTIYSWASSLSFLCTWDSACDKLIPTVDEEMVFYGADDVMLGGVFGMKPRKMR